MTMAHGTISQICLHYFNLQECATKPQEQLDQHNDAFESMRKRCSFLDYAAKEWPVRYTSPDSELVQSSRKAYGVLEHCWNN